MIYKLANTFLELQPLLPPIIKYLKKNGMNQINLVSLAVTVSFFSQDHYLSVNVFLQIKKNKS